MIRVKSKPLTLLQGTTLIEVLVAAIILSVGMLGYAQLQLKTMKQSNDSLHNTLATIMAEDLIERVRSNKSEALKGTSGNYHKPSLEESVPSCTGRDTQGDYDVSLTCTSAELALFDIDEWKETIANGLPNPQSVVCVDSTPEDPTTDTLENLGEAGCDGQLTNNRLVYTVRIIWDGGTANLVNKNLNNRRAYIGSFEP
jgi:type IV pilus assembly protein PilV